MRREPLKGREAYRHWQELGTRWADNDAYGHVNNTIYYAWFDTAINGWLIEAGLLDPEGGNPIGLVVETGCRYARALSFPQSIDVGTAVEHVGSSSVRYRVGVFAKGSAEAAAEGHFVHVYVDRETRRPTPISVKWQSALRELV